MIYTPENARLVLLGLKTQTRRVQKLGEYPDYPVLARDGSIKEVRIGWSRRLKWAVDRNYPIIPGRTKKGVGHETLLSIRLQRLNDITIEDIRAEGVTVPPHRLHESEEIGLKEAWIELWNSIHTKEDRWNDNPLVWALTSRLAFSKGQPVQMELFQLVEQDERIGR